MARAHPDGMTMPRLSGAQIGEQVVQSVQRYLAELRASGATLPSKHGKVWMQIIAADLRPRTAVQNLYKNERARALIEEAALAQGIAPPRRGEQPMSDGGDPRKVARLEARVMQLEQRCASLKAEVDELRAYKHSVEHLFDTGRRIP